MEQNPIEESPENLHPSKGTDSPIDENTKESNNEETSPPQRPPFKILPSLPDVGIYKKLTSIIPKTLLLTPMSPVDVKSDPLGSPLEEEIDTAAPVGELRSLNYFVNIFTTAVVYAGLGGIASVKSKTEELSEGKEGRKLDIQEELASVDETEVVEGVDEDQDDDTEYDEEDIEDEEEDEDEEDRVIGNKDAEKIENDSQIESANLRIQEAQIRHDQGGDDEKVTNLLASLTANKHLDELYKVELERDTHLLSSSIRPPLKRPSIIEHGLEGLQAVAMTAGTAVATKTEPSDESSLPSRDELSTFQNSILDNLDPHLIRESFLLKAKEGETTNNTEDKAKQQRLYLQIADKLQLVFELSDDDYFYGNYNAWLIKDVLLQGHLYLTRESILFFAFLPKRYSSGGGDEEVIQTGSLGMKATKYGETILTTVLTHRFWAILRAETLSFYSSTTDLYFPTLVVDLNTCLRVEIMNSNVNNAATPNENGGFRMGATSPRNNGSSRNSISDDSSIEIDISADDAENVIGGVWFKLVTTKKSYRFHTDNLYSARQWVNNLTKIIFQKQNSNPRNEVLFKIPLEKVIDFQRNMLFTSEEDDPEDAQATTCCVKFTEGDDMRESTHHILTEKVKKRFRKKEVSPPLGNSSFGLDEVYFLFFKNGENFYDKLKDIILERENGEVKADSRRNRKTDVLMDMAKKIVRRDSIDSNSTGRSSKESSRPRSRTISTLNPSTHNQLVKSVMLQPIKNDSETLSARSLTPPPAAPPVTVTLSPTASKMKKIGRLTTPGKLLTRHRSKSCDISRPSSPETETTTLSTPDMNNLSSTSNQVHLPRPLSVTGLKNLNMSFETSQRKIDVAESRYAEEKENDTRNSDGSTNTGLDPSSVPVVLSTPLNLTDPSELDHEPKTKQNKLKTLGKSIKALKNVSNMWLANPTHIVEAVLDDPYFVRDADARDISERHFHNHFLLNSTKKLISSYYCHLQRSIPVYGKLYLGDSELCFRSLLPGVSTRMILPLSDIETCHKEKSMKLTYSGLVIVIRGHEELFFEFGTQKSRDDCEWMILLELEKNTNQFVEDKSISKNSRESKPKFLFGDTPELDIKLASSRIENARIKLFEDKINAAAGLDVPIILEDSPFFKTEIRPSTSYNFTLLSIGSRGDVQPYIALAKGLIAEGHNVTIATHKEFESWVLDHNIKFKEVAGNPTELMSLMVTHGSMSLGFIKEASSKLRGWITELLTTSWEACQGSDVLIESPSAMGGVHIAEALGIPYFRAFTMPWTRTRAYPHAFIVPDQKKGGSYNYLSHVMFETVFWKGISSQVNRWRVEVLGIPRTNLFKLQQTKIPFLYSISPTVFPPSVDFPDWVKVTGYWFLDEGADKKYEPPVELAEFLEKAHKDKKKIVYIGFGSIVVSDAKTLTTAVVDAVLDADVRCILNKGWSDRLSKNEEKNEPEVELPAEIYNTGNIPHDWLFPRIDAAVHHGGSGTTGATLRAGLPTVIKPFFGDQFFFASRVEDLGVGLSLKKLNAKSLSRCLKTATTDTRMIEKAHKVRDRIKHENGVLNAVECIYSELEYARNLILTKQLDHEREIKSETQTPVVYEEDELEIEDEEEDEEEDLEDDDGASIEMVAKKFKQKMAPTIQTEKVEDDGEVDAAEIDLSTSDGNGRESASDGSWQIL